MDRLNLSADDWRHIEERDWRKRVEQDLKEIKFALGIGRVEPVKHNFNFDDEVVSRFSKTKDEV